MWKTLYQLAIPERLYALCGRLIPQLAALSALLLLPGLVWGLAFTPADYQQGEGYRIIYMHAPTAMWSMGIYASMALVTFIAVVWQWKIADRQSRRWPLLAQFIPLSRWSPAQPQGKPMWGTQWIWDAQLTSELVLLFLYAGVTALWHAFDDRRLEGRAASILMPGGVINLPIIHYSVVWWNTLRQGQTNMQHTIDPSMRLPLRICILGFMSLFITLTLMRLRNLILHHERRRPWVIALANRASKGGPL